MSRRHPAMGTSYELGEFVPKEIGESVILNDATDT